MIIWQGMGGFVAIFAIALLYLLTNGLTEPQIMNYNDAFFTTGLVVFALGLYFRHLADRYQQTSFMQDVEKGDYLKKGMLDAVGLNWRRRPSIFFVSAHLWGVAVMLLGLFQILFMPKLA